MGGVNIPWPGVTPRHLPINKKKIIKANLQGGHGVQGHGGGQHGWQHGAGGGQVNQQGPTPHGKIEGQVGQKLIEHILIFQI